MEKREKYFKYVHALVLAALIVGVFAAMWQRSLGYTAAMSLLAGWMLRGIAPR